MADDIEKRIGELEGGVVKPARDPQRNVYGGRDIKIKIRYEAGDQPAPEDYDEPNFDALGPFPNGDRIAIQWPKKKRDGK